MAAHRSMGIFVDAMMSFRFLTKNLEGVNQLWIFIHICIFNKFILFIFGCIGSLLLRGLSLVAVSGDYSLLWYVVFSWRWLLFVVEHGLQARRLQQMWLVGSRAQVSSCGARAQLICGMWDLPGPGLEPVYPALAGRFLTTVPPGKPLDCYIKVKFFLGQLQISIV